MNDPPLYFNPYSHKNKNSSSSNTPLDPLVSSRLSNYQPPAGEDGDFQSHKVGFSSLVTMHETDSLAHNPRSRS